MPVGGTHRLSRPSLQTDVHDAKTLDLNAHFFFDFVSQFG
jgi:hypothetical protein